jgi:hypothetical protein
MPALYSAADTARANQEDLYQAADRLDEEDEL